MKPSRRNVLTAMAVLLMTLAAIVIGLWVANSCLSNMDFMG